ncbi:MAG: hypothetical protein J0H73_06920 [Salana multivorans]|uniref:hypothetical protein n=1 Tax=Salana multivorans TaxID=120377 RepID=UPI00095F8E5F|nr:hypothetical protein [Salana multivorans]MBN8882031.1 hypothetical protein [Salana multivorans]OJX95952.1 MAG: hypothetical protein BGO96_06475 [Micrococcales bacterium 73-15]
MSRLGRLLSPRVFAAVSSVWMLVLAGLTLVPYLAWFRANGEALLSLGEADGAATLVSEAATVVVIYGGVLLLAGLATAWLAWRAQLPWGRGATAWLVACFGGALLTRDVIGAVLLMATVALVLAHRRALATRPAHRPVPAS